MDVTRWMFRYAGLFCAAYVVILLLQGKCDAAAPLVALLWISWGLAEREG